MKLIEKLKNDHMIARKEGDKAKLDTLTMLLSRADRDRLKYDLKDVLEISDEQIQKIVSAEVKSLKDEMSFYKDVEKISKLEKSIEILSNYLPSEMTEDEVRMLMNEVLQSLENKTMKDIIASTKEMYAKKAISSTLPMALVSKIAKQLI